jgi:hypothetical protein
VHHQLLQQSFLLSTIIGIIIIICFLLYSSTTFIIGIYSLQNGKPPLGFLNPFIYNLGERGFHDVVSGCNAGCYQNRGFCALKGFE